VASNVSERRSAGGPSTARRPVIGLSTYVETARYGPWEERAALLPVQYGDAVLDCGGLPVLLPPAPGAAAEALALCDGLVLTGGPDVDPARYGAAAHPETGAPRPDRDDWEFELCRGALAAELPLLAICRGAQVLNVVCGGTLVQHLPERTGHAGHRPGPGRMGTTEVTLDPASRVGRALDPTVTVYCSHHQALDRVADGLEVVGRAADGTVEAVERTGPGFVVGLQWHPEDHPTDHRIFAALVEAARIPSPSGASRP